MADGKILLKSTPFWSILECRYYSFTLYVQKGLYVWGGWGKACHKFLPLGRNSVITLVVSLVMFMNNHRNSSTGEENIKSWLISVFFSLLNSSLTLLFLVLANNLFILLRSSCLPSFCLFIRPSKATLNQQTCELFCLTCAFISGLWPINMYPKQGLERWSLSCPKTTARCLHVKNPCSLGFLHASILKTGWKKLQQTLFILFLKPHRERYFTKRTDVFFP